MKTSPHIPITAQTPAPAAVRPINREDDGRGLCERAASFARAKHAGQQRKDAAATPYIEHPRRVHDLLRTVGGIADDAVLAAALLHDTIEDTQTTPGELRAQFNDHILGIVLETTDDKTLPRAERKRRQLAHAQALSTPAALIKIADKIANVEDVIHRPAVGWSKERRLDYLTWARAVVESCPPVNDNLKRCFLDLATRGRSIIENQAG